MEARNQAAAPIELIRAPWNIGLRPDAQGSLPGTGRAPEVLGQAGLADRLSAARVVTLPRPPYDTEPQPGTRVRNGNTLREHSLLLADAVAAALKAGRMPVVVGGDCSVLLGCLAGARRQHQRIALAHIDGHVDFDSAPPEMPGRVALGSAAGMDLALATGHGERLLTDWPDSGGALVEARQVVQIGDREGDPVPEDLLVIGIHEILETGMAAAADRAAARLDPDLPIWLHVDLDVLDQTVLAAVDSPGSPGLDYRRLTELLIRLRRTGRVLGADITIYDPDLDPGAGQAGAIVDCITAGLLEDSA